MADHREQVEVAGKILDRIDEVPISKDQIGKLLQIDIRVVTRYLKGEDVWFKYRSGHYYRLGPALVRIIAAQKGKATDALERKNEAMARKTEIEIEQMLGDLMPASENIEMIAHVLGGLVELVRLSSMPEKEKENLLDTYREGLRQWEKG